MRISHNLPAMNANRMLGITGKNNAKLMEKLSSGYRINRAADDASGLVISEKMRSLIRGLNQGTENAEDGISYVQIGDGALNEAQDILHRMTELSVKALNGTNTDDDRMAMELEFEALQSELDRIGTTTEFNEINIFEEHEIPYYQCEGGMKWDAQQKHVVTNGQNDLVFNYQETENGPLQTVAVTVPAGEYTTQELVDEIDSALAKIDTGDAKVIFEFAADGYCNANLEGGEMIDSVSGGLSYLLYEMYKGGSFGALIGTTSFLTENAKLEIASGQNNAMSFTVEDFAGNAQEIDITIPDGKYTRSELITILNEKLDGTTVKATAYGNGIKLASEDGIVTGFKGNMFKIDGSGNNSYDSIFYDNVKYGSVTQKAAVFTGGCVLPTDSRDEEHKYYDINSSNNTLTLQPNGAAAPVTITIPQDKYTALEMAAKLNSLFQANGLELSAGRIISGGYEGIQITSKTKGPDSHVNIDTSSSAYQTLFVTREYNRYGAKIQPVNETRADQEGLFVGSKDLSILSSAPLTIKGGTNDAFKLVLDGTEYTITMSGGTYTSVDAVRAELDKQLNGSAALAGYKGKLTVLESNGKLALVGATGQGVNTVRVSEISGNKGFDDLFQGYNVSTSNATVSGKDSITLNTPYDGAIDSSESNITIKVDGTNYNVTLPTGNPSQTEIKNAIETAIPGKTVTTPNQFTTVAAQGTKGNQNFSSTGTGTTTVATWSSSVTGDSNKIEGVAGFYSSTPAVMTIGPSLQSSMTVASANNELVLKLNGVEKSIVLDAKTYTPESLKTALQQKIDAAFGTGMGGAIVSVSGNKLVLTSRLPDGEDGKDTSISCSTSGSSFLKELATTRTAATWTSSRTLNSAITIDDTNRAFQFRYTEGGTTKNISLTLDKNTYDQDSFVKQLNTQLAKTGTGVTASLDAGMLVLTSAAKGSGVSINYGTASGGSSAEALFGPLATPGPANMVVNRNTLDSIVIAPGDTFSIKVNGATQTVTLDDGTYTRDSFVSMLNSKLSGVTAYVSGSKLGYTTTATGTSASLSMTYAGGGTSMKAIYGETTTEYAGVKVSFDANGYMTLGTTKAGSTISVSSATGSAFQTPSVTSTPIATSYSDGYHSVKHSYIDGASLGADVTIDEWNNNLTFTFQDSGVNKNVTIEVPQTTYAHADLQTKLQELIDAQVGSGKIAVTVGSSGVRLEAVNVGSTNQFSGFSGDFYDKVICSCVEQTVTLTPTDKAGTQTVDSAYTVGRKDVKNQTTVIRSGVNDELTLDLTYGNTVHEISVTLDAGKYNGDQLKVHLQEKLNEQMKNLGLHENLIEVGIGGINTGVYGSNDRNALNFSLSKTVQTPAEGQFIIDGVSGNAAFEIFYQTNGTLEPAYIMGTKDVTEGVTIPPGEEDLGVVVDGISYSVMIPAGEYTQTELLTTVNDALDAVGAPIVAELDEGKLKLSHKKMGEHEIEEVSGSAKYHMFFSENGKAEPEGGRFVQLSSVQDDRIEIKRQILSTAYLGINSCCISKEKYAGKALERIEKALAMVSAIRSDFGSTQNRIEHAINNNRNKAENLQSAESQIRDADMALEMVRFSNSSIIQQAGQAVLAQANQNQERILSLLQ